MFTLAESSHVYRGIGRVYFAHVVDQIEPARIVARHIAHRHDLCAMLCRVVEDVQNEHQQGMCVSFAICGLVRNRTVKPISAQHSEELSVIFVKGIPHLGKLIEIFGFFARKQRRW